MHGAHEVLQAITVVLCVAAVTTVVFHRLRQPVVLGYLVAGLIVGPDVPIPWSPIDRSSRRCPSWGSFF